MARLCKVRIKGFRSIGEECEIAVPTGVPLVLIGENNAGKSNIIKALDVVLGEHWPGSRDVEDHDFWGREPHDVAIEIEVFADGLVCSKAGEIESLFWACHSDPPREPRFRAFTPDHDERFASNELRRQCQAMIVNADRRLSYQLSYTSKWTFLSRLMHRFHEHLVSDDTRVERLKAEFGKIVGIFEEVKEFQAFRGGLAEQFGEVLKGMSYGLNVDFSAYDPSNFFRSLRVLPNENGEPRTLDELGTGQEQVLALVFAHAYARAFFEEGSIVLVIEEPEAHLHPLAQEWLGRLIRMMSRDGLQVILTTHSPAFVDILGLEGLVLVRKPGESTAVTQLTRADLAASCVLHGSDAESTDDEAILPFYASAATSEILAGLFARKVVLVEGQTEGMALPTLLLKAGLDTVKRGIAVIPVLGKGNLAKWWRFFNAYGLPVYVIFDNDGKNDKEGARRMDLLTTLDVPEEQRATLMAETGWLVEGNCSIFGTDFETTLREALPGYEEIEEEAQEELGSESKPLIAKYVADRVEVDVASAGGKQLQALAEAIRFLEGPEAA